MRTQSRRRGRPGRVLRALGRVPTGTVSHWCEGHHIEHWSHGGETNLSNLVLECSRHHHLLHQGGWHLKLLPDATVEVTTPDGRVLTSHPPRGSPAPLLLE